MVAAGFGSSAISVSQQDGTTGALRWTVFGLGVVISLFTAINQLWKPGMRSVSSYRAGNALRREGWDFVFDGGSYRAHKDDPNQAFDLFVDRVREIQAQVDSIDEVQAEVTGHLDDANQPPGGGPSKEKGEKRSACSLVEQIDDVVVVVDDRQADHDADQDERGEDEE